MWFSTRAVPLPDHSMLDRYAGNDHDYTDCYAAKLKAPVSLAEYIEAFYTSPVFKLERWILSIVIGKSSTDRQARELAAGNRGSFSAWRVEDRDSEQILLSDFRGRTRSWLMVESLAEENSTRLYFGSAVVLPTGTSKSDVRPSLSFRMLLGFHKLYSRILLSLARRALVAASRHGNYQA